MTIHISLMITLFILGIGFIICHEFLPADNPKCNIIGITSIISLIIGVGMMFLFSIGTYMLKTQTWKDAQEPYKIEHIVSLNDCKS